MTGRSEKLTHVTLLEVPNYKTVDDCRRNEKSLKLHVSFAHNGREGAQEISIDKVVSLNGGGSDYRFTGVCSSVTIYGDDGILLYSGENLLCKVSVFGAITEVQLIFYFRISSLSLK